MPEQYTIRPAVGDDLTLIAGMWGDLALQHKSYDAECWNFRPDAAEGFVRYLKTQLDDADAFLLVAVDEADLPVGFVLGKVSPAIPVMTPGKVGTVTDLFVSRTHRRRKLGRHLMTAAFAKMKSLGAREVSLSVAAANETVVEMYRKMGLRIVMHRMFKTL
jgi:ribosomal protein S18 acetylase RimI-like enzyme